MELAELTPRLVVFARSMYDDPTAVVDEVHTMPGHGVTVAITHMQPLEIEKKDIALGIIADAFCDTDAK